MINKYLYHQKQIIIPLPSFTKLVILLVMTGLAGCTSDVKKELSRQEQDSLKLEAYLKWKDGIKSIDIKWQDSTALVNAEKNRDTTLLLNFMRNFKDSTQPFHIMGTSLHDMLKFVYAIDINGDTLKDIIYNGPSGGEPQLTNIYLNTGTSYRPVFSGFQNITHLKFNEDRLLNFTLLNPGCCADPQVVEYYYSLQHTNNIPTFKIDSTIGYIYNTEKAPLMEKSTKTFLISKPFAILRYDTYFFDNIEHYVYGTNGNHIANYPNGASGKILGYKKDKSNDWLYVQMDASVKLDSCGFSTFNERPTALRGWLLKSDTDIK
jgi:hypothetical protein